MSHSLTKIGRDYAVPQWKFYLGGTIALIITNIIVLEIPLLAKKIIDAIAKQQNLDQLTTVSVAIIALGFAQILIRTTSRILIFWPGRTLESEIKSDLFTHLVKSPLDKLVNFNIGDLTSRLNNDVTQMRIFFAFGALQVLNVIFISLFTVSKMASIDKILTALAISPMLCMLLLTKLVMPKLYTSMRENTEALGRLTGRVSEAFAQVHVIQSMNAIAQITERLRPDNESIFQSNIRTIWLRTLTWPVMTVLIGASQFATLTWGGRQIIAGHMTVGDIMAFNIYIGMLTFPFASLGIILNVYQRAKPAAERIETINIIEPEGKLTKSPIGKLDLRAPLLEIKNVSFYWPDGREALSHVTFSVDRGERVGIFGKIGSGKTTLFNLITKLYPHSNGEILIHGQNINSMQPEAVRSMIGYALQQPLLFSESVKSNLCLGRENDDLSIDQLERAALRADVLDDIKKLPEVWETPIGERGIKLSGGQKQRLALARLLLRNSELIILDDVLSSVDHETEHRLINSLLASKSALLIASHRVSILEPCDRVIILDAGKIVAQGKYQEVKHLIEIGEARPNSGTLNGADL